MFPIHKNLHCQDLRYQRRQDYQKDSSAKSSRAYSKRYSYNATTNNTRHEIGRTAHQARLVFGSDKRYICVFLDVNGGSLLLLWWRPTIIASYSSRSHNDVRSGRMKEWRGRHLCLLGGTKHFEVNNREEHYYCLSFVFSPISFDGWWQAKIDVCDY